MKIEFKEFFANIRRAVSDVYMHTTHHKNVLKSLILEKGWFPSSITLRHDLKENETIDSFMERCISGDYYYQIKNVYILSKYLNRREIFQEAFNSYEDERYISCIPLLLSQVDGIIMDSGLKGFFLGKNE